MRSSAYRLKLLLKSQKLIQECKMLEWMRKSRRLRLSWRSSLFSQRRNLIKNLKAVPCILESTALSYNQEPCSSREYRFSHVFQIRYRSLITSSCVIIAHLTKFKKKFCLIVKTTPQLTAVKKKKKSQTFCNQVIVFILTHASHKNAYPKRS